MQHNCAFIALCGGWGRGVGLVGFLTVCLRSRSSPSKPKQGTTERGNLRAKNPCSCFTPCSFFDIRSMTCGLSPGRTPNAIPGATAFFPGRHRKAAQTLENSPILFRTDSEVTMGTACLPPPPSSATQPLARHRSPSSAIQPPARHRYPAPPNPVTAGSPPLSSPAQPC